MYLGDPTLWFAATVVITVGALLALVIAGRKY